MPTLATLSTICGAPTFDSGCRRASEGLGSGRSDITNDISRLFGHCKRFGWNNKALARESRARIWCCETRSFKEWPWLRWGINRKSHEWRRGHVAERSGLVPLLEGG